MNTIPAPYFLCLCIYRRVLYISFLTGAGALLGMGIFMVYDSSIALIKADHPTIGSKIFFGYIVWMGWVIILAIKKTGFGM